MARAAAPSARRRGAAASCCWPGCRPSAPRRGSTRATRGSTTRRSRETSATRATAFSWDHGYGAARLAARRPRGAPHQAPRAPTGRRRPSSEFDGVRWEATSPRGLDRARRRRRSPPRWRSAAIRVSVRNLSTRQFIAAGTRCASRAPPAASSTAGRGPAPPAARSGAGTPTLAEACYRAADAESRPGQPPRRGRTFDAPPRAGPPPVDAAAHRYDPARRRPCRPRLCGDPRAALGPAGRRPATVGHGGRCAAPAAACLARAAPAGGVRTPTSSCARCRTTSQTGSPTREPPPQRRAARRASCSRTGGLLPAVLRRDGAAAAHGRRPRARRGRLLARARRDRKRASTSSATSTRTPGSRPTSPARLGDVRPDARRRAGRAPAARAREQPSGATDGRRDVGRRPRGTERAPTERGRGRDGAAVAVSGASSPAAPGAAAAARSLAVRRGGAGAPAGARRARARAAAHGPRAAPRDDADALERVRADRRAPPATCARCAPRASARAAAPTREQRAALRRELASGPGRAAGAALVGRSRRGCRRRAYN